MNKMLLHTPEGVRDIYGTEYAIKQTIEENISKTIKKYGYRGIQTPTFEFFDIFNKERGSVASKDMYKFFDREGNTLVLRPDMTPSIARAAAKYYKEVNAPIRLCYKSNTYINKSEHQGKLKESTQLGCELIGDNSIDADAEVIAVIIDSLLSSGLSEFQVEVGQVDFFKGIVEESGMDMKTEEQLRELIEIKNYFGVEELLSTQNMTEELKTVFMKLPELFGSADILKTAKELTENRCALKAIERLEKMYSILENYGLSRYVSFDLGMLSNFEYYTGIIFKAYTYDTGDAIVTGGRYDALLSQFGKKAPSVGFGINIDGLLVAISRQKINIDIHYNNTEILYKSSLKKSALEIAKRMRNNNINVELNRKSSKYELTDYLEFARINEVDRLIYMDTAENVTEYNIKENTNRKIKMKEL
ncbi:MAG: ATP phosphoribosyltransferase regulatory subunit [Eubacterium sp.]